MFGKHKFRVGQRVKPSAEGINANLFWRYRNKLKTFTGTVTKVDKFNCPTVLWDGRKTVTGYHADFIEPSRVRKTALSQEKE